MALPEPYYHDEKAGISIYCGNVFDVLPTLESESVQCCITSPPYWALRDYGTDGQLGLEATPEEYVARMVNVFREVRRLLRDDGTLWLNLGDVYHQGPKGNSCELRPTDKQASNIGSFDTRRGKMLSPTRSQHLPGLKPKDICGIPWRVAFALQADGWYLRQDIIWHKSNPMPESVTDRCTKAHEYVFLLSKSARYYFDAEAVKEESVGRERFGNWGQSCPDRKDNGRQDMEPTTHRNRRSVWTIPTEPYSKAHFATYPTALVRTCLLAGCPTGGVVLDPFLGSGTTAAVARKNGCGCVGVELNAEYADMAANRLSQGVLPFTD